MSEKLIERSSYETKRKVKLNGAGMPQTKLSSGMQSLSLSLSFSLSLALKSEPTSKRMFWTDTSLMSLFILKENEKRQEMTTNVNQRKLKNVSSVRSRKLGRDAAAKSNI